MVRMNTWDPPKTPCFQQAIDPETGAPRGGSNPQTDPSWEAGLPNKLLCGKDSSLYQYLCFFSKDPTECHLLEEIEVEHYSESSVWMNSEQI